MAGCLPRRPCWECGRATRARAYPVARFSGESKQLDERLDGKAFTLEYDARSQTLRISQADEGVQWMYSFWFGWAAFQPETKLYQNEAAQ